MFDHTRIWALAVLIASCAEPPTDPAPPLRPVLAAERTTRIDPAPPTKPAAPQAPAAQAPAVPTPSPALTMRLPDGTPIAVSETQPFIGLPMWVDDGSDEGITLVLQDRGIDQRPPPPLRQRIGSNDPPISMELFARAELPISVETATMVDFDDACEARIARALDLYATFDEYGRPPSRYVGLVLSSRCIDSGGILGVAGVSVHLRSLDVPLSPVPQRVLGILEQSDRNAADYWRSDGLPAQAHPGALSFASHDVVYLRGRYQNELVVQGTRIVEQNEPGSAHFKAMVEAGPRMFVLVDEMRGDDHAVDVDTGREVSY
jgi:hypothetical protein